MDAAPDLDRAELPLTTRSRNPEPARGVLGRMRRIAPRASLAGLLCLSACAGAPVGPTDARATPGQRRARTEHGAVDRCTGHDGLEIDPVAPIAADWQGAVTIGGHGEVTVRWCGEGTVSIVSLTLGPDDGGELGAARFIRSPDPARARLVRGGSLTDEIAAPAQPGPLLLVVEATTDRGETITARAPLESVDDPERAALRGECVAAGGTWGPHGMMGHESCDRPTRDAGQRCTSDADCEGPCIETGTEPLGGGAPPGVAVPACGPGRQPHLAIGRCHDRSLRFGCHPRLFDVTIECVGPVLGRRVHAVCVD